MAKTGRPGLPVKTHNLFFSVELQPKTSVKVKPVLNSYSIHKEEQLHISVRSSETTRNYKGCLSSSGHFRYPE